MITRPVALAALVTAGAVLATSGPGLDNAVLDAGGAARAVVVSLTGERPPAGTDMAVVAAAIPLSSTPVSSGSLSAHPASARSAVVPVPMPPTPPTRPVTPRVASVTPPQERRPVLTGVFSPQTAPMAPPRSCPQANGPAGTVPVRVVAAPGSVTLTWWHPGDPDVVTYRVGALMHSLRVPLPGATTASAIVWQSVPAISGCRNQTMVFTGLTRGDRYQFVIETDSTDHVRGGLVHRTVARTETVTVG
jgi:hypothetical protein